MHILPVVYYEQEGTGGATPEAAPPPTPAPVAEPIAEAKPEATPTAEPVAAAPVERPWYEKRIDQLTREWRQTQQRAADLERQLAAQTVVPPQGTLPEEEIDRRANLRAQQIAAQESFNRTCDTIYDSGVTTHGQQEFDISLNTLKGVCGGILPPQLIEAAAETGRAAEVIFALGQAPDKAMEMLSLPPLKMAARVAAMAAGLGVKPRPVSKVPEPIVPQVGGRGVAANSVEDPGLSMAEFAKLREKQVAERRGR